MNMHTCPLVLIPTALLVATRINDTQNWMLDWKQTTAATMLGEVRALNALALQRFVRRNVSMETFLAWKQENARPFITERVSKRIKAKAT